MKKLEIVDFLKGYSIFTIILFHFLQTYDWQHIGGKLISFGGTGVHLFVLLSGFGLYLSHQSKPLSYFRFLKKRFIKIYIPYVLIVVLTAIISLFFPIFKSSLYALGGHVFLYKMFDESIMGSYGYALWFISMIIQFYLSFHIILFLKEKTGPKSFLLISLLISLIWTIFVILIGKETQRVWNSFFLRYLWEFALGMYLAERFFNGNSKFKSNKLFLLFFGLLNCVIYALLALKGGETGKMLNDIPALFGYSSLAAWLHMLDIKFVNKFFMYTGSISYSLYLWHTLILMSLIFIFKSLNLNLVLIIAFVLVYVISGIYQKLLKLFMK